MDGKIFISIAAYRDALLKNTILEAYNKAEFKDRLVFGVFEQTSLPDCLDLGQFHFRDQIRWHRVDPEYTKGVCWARKHIQSMYRGEQYYFQIDAHMLFDPGWDKNLIDALEEIKRYNQKPIITGYPNGFEHDFSAKREYHPGHINIISTSSDRNDKFQYMGFCPPYGGSIASQHRAVYGFHLGACFIFCDGNFVREVPYDDAVFFGGEEPILSLRAWTHGYDIFHIGELRTWHCWHKPYGGVVQRDLENGLGQVYMDQAREYIEKLVSRQVSGPYGLGNQRTVEQYIKYSGLNYFKKEFNENPEMFKVPYYTKLTV